MITHGAGAINSLRNRPYYLDAQRLTIVGLLLGVTTAYGGGRLLAAYIYAMRAADPCVLVAAGATVME